MDLKDAIYGRRAVREYTTARVDQGLLQRLIEAAIQAPSALNRQPWLFTVVCDQQLLAEISEKSKAHLLATLGEGSDRGIDHIRKMLSDPKFHIFYHAPGLIVISASQAGRWEVEDCALAAENLMLAAYASGLGTCWIGLAQAWLGTAEGKTALRLDRDDAVPVAPIIVGYPKVQPGPVPRREPIIHWIG
jgi:nitroreductase